MNDRLGLLVKLESKNDVALMLKRVTELGFSSCQVSTYNPEIYSDEIADLIRQYMKEYNVDITLWWAGWPGHVEWNFTNGPATVGLVPLSTRRERCELMKKAADFAASLGVDRIATHLGFIPEDMHNPLYTGLIPELQDIADHLKKNGQYFCFETGQETPVTLLRTIEDIGRDNIGINLDPANLIMYGKANAADSLKVLGKHLKGVHIKDGKYPTDGRELGIEVPIGEGDVNMPLFLERLDECGYNGPLTIEIELDRRLGNSAPEDAIRDTVRYLEKYIG